MFADREDELLLTATMEDKLDKTGKCPVMTQCELCTMDDLIQKGQAEKTMVLCTLTNSKVEYYWKYDYKKSSHAFLSVWGFYLLLNWTLKYIFLSSFLK